MQEGFTDYWVPSQRNKMPLEARRICEECPVGAQCKEFAKQESRGRSHKEVYGNLDGRTPVERFQEMKSIALAAKIAAEKKQREQERSEAIARKNRPWSDGKPVWNKDKKGKPIRKTEKAS